MPRDISIRLGQDGQVTEVVFILSDRVDPVRVSDLDHDDPMRMVLICYEEAVMSSVKIAQEFAGTLVPAPL